MSSNIESKAKVNVIDWLAKSVVAVLWVLVTKFLAAIRYFQNVSNDQTKSVKGQCEPVQSDAAKDKFYALKKAIPANCFIRAHKRLYLSLFDEERSSVMALHQLKQNFIVVSLIPRTRAETGSQTKAFSVGSLTEIFKFDAETRALARQNPGRKLVFCTGADDPLVSKDTRARACMPCMRQREETDRPSAALSRRQDPTSRRGLAAAAAAAAAATGADQGGAPPRLPHAHDAQRRLRAVNPPGPATGLQVNPPGPATGLQVNPPGPALGLQIIRNEGSTVPTASERPTKSGASEKAPIRRSQSATIGDPSEPRPTHRPTGTVGAPASPRQPPPDLGVALQGAAEEPPRLSPHNAAATPVGAAPRLAFRCPCLDARAGRGVRGGGVTASRRAGRRRWRACMRACVRACVFL